MQNDSIETLLLRHYGNAAPAPVDLEDKLYASMRQQVEELHEQERIAMYLGQRHLSRRRAVRLVALGTAGVGALSVGLEGLRMIEAALTGQDVTKPAYS